MLVCLQLIIYLAGIIMEQFEYRSRWYKAAILSCIVLSPGLLEDYSMMWSETLFIFISPAVHDGYVSLPAIPVPGKH